MAEIPLTKPILIALGLTLAACGGQGTDTPDPTDAATPTLAPGEGFESALPNGGSGYDDPVASPGDDSENDGGGEERAVEEADILNQVGDTLFVLNTYRGLQALDVSNPDDPSLLGRLPLIGYPVEMYIREGRAYIILSDYYSYWPMAEVGDSALGVDSFRGSILAIADVSDPTNPTLVGQIKLDGFVSQTRAVGDVIYAVSNQYAWYNCGGASTDDEDKTVVTSIDIHDPANPVQVDSVSWAGMTAQIHATSSTLFVTEPVYSYDEHEGEEEEEEPDDEEGGEPPPEESGSAASATADDDDPTPTERDDEGGEEEEEEEEEDPAEPVEPDEEPSTGGTSYYGTGITIIDIDDPQGLIEERGYIEVPGQTWDKFALDAYEGTFRVVTQKYDGVSSATLSVVDLADLDNPTLLSTMDIILPIQEWVTAARFDKERGYIVTAERNDPLFIVDLANPAEPRLAGEVVMPGQLDHIEPRGDRLIAFGQDNTEEGTWVFAVSLFDVTDMDAPLMLDRETVGEGDYSWSLASWDDKSFTILDDQGLIAVPFSAYEEDTWRYLTGVQLVDFDDESVTMRGSVGHPGYIRRVRDVGDRLYSISDTTLLAIDATDRDAPRVTAERALAQYIADYMPLGDIGARLVTSGYYWYGAETNPALLEIVPGDSPDGMAIISSLEFDAQDGFLVDLGDDTLGVLHTTYGDDYKPSTTLDVVSIANPAAPSVISTTELPGPIFSYANAYGSGYGSYGGALVRSGQAFAWLETSYYYYDYEEAPQEGDDSEGDGGDSGEGEDSGEGDSPDSPEGTPTPEAKAKIRTLEEGDILSRMHILDLSDPSAPTTATFEFEESLFSLIPGESGFLATHAVQIGDEWPYSARYYVNVIDPALGRVGAPINVPGTALRSLDGGDSLLTLDVQWRENSEGYSYTESSLNLVDLNNGRARRVDMAELPGYVYGVQSTDIGAYVLSQPFYWENDTPDSDYGCYYSQGLDLLSLSLNDDSIDIASTQTLPLPYGYMRALTDEALFIDGYGSGLMVYSLEDPEAPRLNSFIRTSGWALHVRTEGGMAYLPAGMYGVSVAEL